MVVLKPGSGDVAGPALVLSDEEEAEDHQGNNHFPATAVAMATGLFPNPGNMIRESTLEEDEEDDSAAAGVAAADAEVGTDVEDVSTPVLDVYGDEDETTPSSSPRQVRLSSYGHEISLWTLQISPYSDSRMLPPMLRERLLSAVASLATSPAGATTTSLFSNRRKTSASSALIGGSNSGLNPTKEDSPSALRNSESINERRTLRSCHVSFSSSIGFISSLNRSSERRRSSAATAGSAGLVRSPITAKSSPPLFGSTRSILR